MTKGFVTPHHDPWYARQLGIPDMSGWPYPAPRDVHATRPFVDDVDPASREPAEGEDFERLHWTQEKLAEG